MHVCIYGFSTISWYCDITLKSLEDDTLGRDSDIFQQYVSWAEKPLVIQTNKSTSILKHMLFIKASPVSALHKLKDTSIFIQFPKPFKKHLVFQIY